MTNSISIRDGNGAVNFLLSRKETTRKYRRSQELLLDSKIDYQPNKSMMMFQCFNLSYYSIASCTVQYMQLIDQWHGSNTAKLSEVLIITNPTTSTPDMMSSQLA